MPGRLFLTRPMAEVAAWLAGTGPVLSDAVTKDPFPNDPPRYNIAPGQQVICRTARGLEHARWGMIPVGRVNARRRPVMETILNARSGTVFDKMAFAGWHTLRGQGGCRGLVWCLAVFCCGPGVTKSRPDHSQG